MSRDNENNNKKGMRELKAAGYRKIMDAKYNHTKHQALTLNDSFAISKKAFDGSLDNWSLTILIAISYYNKSIEEDKNIESRLITKDMIFQLLNLSKKKRLHTKNFNEGFENLINSGVVEIDGSLDGVFKVKQLSEAETSSYVLFPETTLETLIDVTDARDKVSLIASFASVLFSIYYYTQEEMEAGGMDTYKRAVSYDNQDVIAERYSTTRQTTARHIEKLVEMNLLAAFSIIMSDKDGAKTSNVYSRYEEAFTLKQYVMEEFRAGKYHKLVFSEEDAAKVSQPETKVDSIDLDEVAEAIEAETTTEIAVKLTSEQKTAEIQSILGKDYTYYEQNSKVPYGYVVVQTTLDWTDYSWIEKDEIVYALTKKQYEPVTSFEMMAKILGENKLSAATKKIVQSMVDIADEVSVFKAMSNKYNTIALEMNKEYWRDKAAANKANKVKQMVKDELALMTKQEKQKNEVARKFSDDRATNVVDIDDWKARKDDSHDALAEALAISDSNDDDLDFENMFK